MVSTLIVQKRLDADQFKERFFIYRFNVTATDFGNPPLSSNATVSWSSNEAIQYQGVRLQLVSARKDSEKNESEISAKISNQPFLEVFPFLVLLLANYRFLSTSKNSRRHGAPPGKDLKTFQIHIRTENTNDEAPIFYPTRHYTAYVAEDAQGGTPVVQIQVRELPHF